MQDRFYLLSLQEAFQESRTGELLELSCEKLDRERLRRAERIKQEKKRIQSVGAGLLLQLAVQEAEKDKNVGKDRNVEIDRLSFAELLDRLGEPLSLEYVYGKNGKPYFDNYPYYFSLSHSGGYVACVLSEEEIGLDIQQQRLCNVQAFARRFFSEEEQVRLEQKSPGRERLQLFYELWCCKEAYGKLTGEGIAGGLGVETPYGGKAEKVQIRRLPAPEGYCLTVCKWKEKTDRSSRTT